MRMHRNPRTSGKSQSAHACGSCEKERSSATACSNRRRREKEFSNQRASFFFVFCFFAPNLGRREKNSRTSAHFFLLFRSKTFFRGRSCRQEGTATAGYFPSRGRAAIWVQQEVRARSPAGSQSADHVSQRRGATLRLSHAHTPSCKKEAGPALRKCKPRCLLFTCGAFKKNIAAAARATFACPRPKTNCQTRCAKPF